MVREKNTGIDFSSRESHGMLIILAGAIVTLALLGIPQSRAAFSSVEVQYADNSTGGMRIIPASCPSSPHGGSDCTTCTAAYICVGSDRYYRSAACSNTFVENCPYGCSNGLCLPAPDCPASNPNCLGACTPQYFCFGNNLHFRSSQCADTFIQACAYGCSAGACNIAPAGTLDIQVSPSVVRIGDPTTVSWTSSGMEACSVTEDSPEFNDAWSGVTGSQGSSDITQRTVYTLTCRDEDDNVYTDTATVNVLPVFEET